MNSLLYSVEAFEVTTVIVRIKLIAGLVLATVVLALGFQCVQKVPEILEREEPRLSLESEAKIRKARDAFDSLKKFDSLSLEIDGDSLTIIGRDIEEIKSEFSVSQDPNGEFSRGPSSVTDYFLTDPKLDLSLKEGSINGICYLSTLKEDKEDQRVFNVSGSWLFDFDLGNEELMEEARSAIARLFPTIENNLRIKDGWEHWIEKGTLVEHFSISLPKQSGSSYGRLNYDVTLK